MSLLIILSGPSGAGKDAVLNRMKELNLPFDYMITSTTRPPRSGEKDGIEYHFVSESGFQEMLQRGDLIESAKVYGYWYGVPKHELKQGLDAGKDLILKMDVQGAATIRNLLPGAVLVFLTLPFALIGGVCGAFLGGGNLSLGSLVGFVTVLGIAGRNGIMLVSHYRHLQTEEGVPFGRELVLRGSAERLAPVLMTALATALALLPLVVAGQRPGHEVEHPMAVVILGGLVTSTALNLLVLPALYLRFGGGTLPPREGADE